MSLCNENSTRCPNSIARATTSPPSDFTFTVSFGSEGRGMSDRFNTVMRLLYHDV
jgi:hypothetical protein